MALLNDFNNDFKTLLKTEGMVQMDLAAKSGIDQPHISRAIKQGKQFNESFVKIIEALGYDIKVSYVKREKSVKEVIDDERRKADRNKKG